MQLVATDLLADACGLSVGPAVIALLAGLVLWLFGWQSHRFWVVLATTVLAGIFGLTEAPALQAQPLAAAVLLALAAGLLALSLVRVIGFFAAGLTVLLFMQELWPGLNQPVLTFLVGGLLSLLLFRWCVMALTSYAGTLLAIGGVLMLVHLYAHTDVVAWAERSSGLLNVLCVLLTFFGFAIQFALDRRETKRRKAEEGGKGKKPLRLLGWGWGSGGGGGHQRRAA